MEHHTVRIGGGEEPAQQDALIVQSPAQGLQRLRLSKKYIEVAPAPILHLHRHQDGYIAFATERDGDDWRDLVAIRAGELENWFPLFRDQLLKDAYVGINADWRLSSYGEHGDSYGYPRHRTDHLRYINAAYVDIDYHKLGLDAGTVIGRVINLQDSGILPHASMIVKSGRGLWLLWLVHDLNAPEQSPGAFPEKLDLYGRIQQAIIERLLPLGADLAARDACRHIRLPGSLHSESEKTVEWWIQGANESGYVYTLNELAERLRATPVHRHGREIIAHNPAKRRGWVALNARRLRDFNTLRALRAGFSEGCRNNAAKIYCWLLRANGMVYDAYGLTDYMGKECHPSLSKSEVKAAFQYSKKMRRMKDQTISDWLNVTAAESELLEGFPPAGRLPLAPARVPIASIRQTVAARRAAIQAILAEVGYVPTVRAMSGLIQAKGFRGNPRTVLTDYKSLGVMSDRTMEARAKREDKQPQGSLFYCMQSVAQDQE